MPALPATSPIWYPLVAALISAGLAFYAWPRRFARGGRPFIGCLSVFSFVFLAQALMRAADVLFLKVLFFQLWVVLAAATTLLGLWLACEYAGITRRMSRVLWFALCFPLAAFSLLALTNGAHRLIWSRFWVEGPLFGDLTPLGVVGIAYLSLLALLCPLVFFIVAGRTHGLLRWQAALLATGALIVCAALPGESFRLSPIAGTGLSTTLGLAGVIVAAVALFKFRAFDLTPIARDALVEQSSYGMMVLDEEHRVVDLNPAARRILGPAGKRAIGKPAREVLGQWPELLRIATYGSGTRAEVSVSDDESTRIYEASVSPFLDLTGGSMARLVVWFDITEAKATRAELERQRAALAAAVERDRVARELHDGLAQTLAFVKMQTQAARDALERDCRDEAFEDLSGMLPVVQDAHDEIRDFLLGSKGPAKDGGNFWASVIDFTERFTLVHGVRVYTTIPPEARRVKLDPLTQVQLLRIIQESLSNVRKHARVGSATVGFTVGQQLLRVVIHDDGVGFDRDAVAGAEAGHYGLTIMRERAEEIGGSLDVISQPGTGTAVFVEVPLNGGRKDRSSAFAVSR